MATLRKTLMAGSLVALHVVALAGVRPLYTVDYSRSIDPDALVRPFIEGDHDVGGGVFFSGKVHFYVEDGSDAVRVLSNAIRLEAVDDGSLVAVLGEERFKYETHPNMACALSKMVIRGGELAFSIPPNLNPERLNALGMTSVPTSDRLRMISAAPPHLEGMARNMNAYVAKEFVGTSSATMLFLADFAEVDPLPSDFRSRLISKVKSQIEEAGAGGSPHNGSYFNSDVQTIYRGYLDRESKTLDLEGGPLRYHWRSDIAGMPSVVDIEAISQNWPDSASMTRSMTTQYDFIVAWQTAALFREINATHPQDFRALSSKVCDQGQSRSVTPTEAR